MSELHKFLFEGLPVRGMLVRLTDGWREALRRRQSTQATPEPVRRLMWQRDHGPCKVPGCGASRYLDLHHLQWRTNGGDHRPINLILLCGAHHRAHHDGKLRIDGDSPDRLLFTHADGTAYGTHRVADAQSALRNLGFKSAEATAAVQRAQAHVGPDASLQDFIRVCLQECST